MFNAAVGRARRTPTRRVVTALAAVALLGSVSVPHAAAQIGVVPEHTQPQVTTRHLGQVFVLDEGGWSSVTATDTGAAASVAAWLAGQMQTRVRAEAAAPDFDVSVLDDADLSLSMPEVPLTPET